ncbi:hypothetical protein E5288_WYG018893 [Bos mutus]|uniref:ubiquitinyl hydrolase 1 n=3 Tax=Artiodactyla TaxID=91561 RepID=A0A6B0S2I2_9CETA|nr:hypothetical protein [Bos mutus]
MEGQRWLPLEANPEVTNQVSENKEEFIKNDKERLTVFPIEVQFTCKNKCFFYKPRDGEMWTVVILSSGKSFLGEPDCEMTNTVHFLKQLGLHPNWQFVDVYGMDPELLSMVPRPVCAVLLLFPITEKYEVFRTEEEEKIKSQGQDVTSSVYFMKQTISNACGTIGLIHAIANNKDKMHFESGSTLKKFLEESASMSPEERARYLENYDAIRVTHETSAHEGQTEAPNIDEKVDLHFIALVHVDGHLYELDGRKPFPINHGETSDETLLEDAIEVCKKFMERDPDELRFNAIALSAA